MPDLLDTIVAATERIVEIRTSARPLAELEREAFRRTPRGEAFIAALARPDRVNVIAECKRRSPSRGVLRPKYDPVEIAQSYERAGAAALSVLTEPAFFDGSLEHLAAVREAVAVPVLRKDFILTDYQLAEARAAGADAVLVIVAALEDGRLGALITGAGALGLAALVEVHDEEECARAIDAGAKVIGVNNRNLRTLDVDLGASERVIERLPRGIVAVAESGIARVEDVRRLRSVGYHAFLVGEHLMTSADPGAALRALVAP